MGALKQRREQCAPLRLQTVEDALAIWRADKGQQFSEQESKRAPAAAFARLWG